MQSWTAFVMIINHRRLNHRGLCTIINLLGPNPSPGCHFKPASRPFWSIRRGVFGHSHARCCHECRGAQSRSAPQVGSGGQHCHRWLVRFDINLMPISSDNDHDDSHGDDSRGEFMTKCIHMRSSFCRIWDVSLLGLGSSFLSSLFCHSTSPPTSNKGYPLALIVATGNMALSSLITDWLHIPILEVTMKLYKQITPIKHH